MLGVEVILTCDVPNLGKRDQVLRVADGYARNYLLPKGLAVPADASRLRDLQHRRAGQRGAEERQVRGAMQLREQLEGTRVHLAARAGPEGRLFGSVTAMDIAAALKGQAKVNVDRRRLVLDEPLKALGEHVVAVKLGHDVVAHISVLIEPQ